MQTKYKKLLKNTTIFSIGSFGSKILNFLIVPLYTYLLTTEEYGTIDLFITTIGFIVPIITMQVQESMLRFLLAKELPEDKVLSNCFVVYIGGAILALLAMPIYYSVWGSVQFAVIFAVLISTNTFNTIFPHYLKAIGKNLAFAMQGVISTLSFLTCNVIFLVFLHQGMMGYLYANVISQVLCVLYVTISGKLVGKLSFKTFDLPTLKLMLKFSVPLIPNSLMWWVMASGDKYIINVFLGSSANGIYALALKIPTIISMFYALFFQAWQMSAIEENNSEERKNFYETVYNVTNALLSLLVVGIILFVKPLYVLLMSESFSSAWMYVPFLCIGIAYSCQSSFFGVVYTTSKKTTKAFITTFLGAVLNIGFNLIFVQFLGLQGVAIGTCLGYMAVTLIRSQDAKKEININLDIKRLFCVTCILILQSLITIYLSNLYLIIIGVLSFITCFILYRKEFSAIIKKVMRREIL